MERRARVVSTGDDWQEVRRRNRRSNQHPIIEKATSIFISDFPPDWVEADLWRFLKNFGVLVDVYIASKRSKSNSRFGFARYIRVSNLQDLVNSLNGARCGNSRLRANLAKYERKKVTPPPNYFANNMPQVNRRESHINPQRMTYAEVVGNRKVTNETNINRHLPPPPPPPAHYPPHPRPNPYQEPKELRFLTSVMSKKVVKNTLIGESESFEKLMNVKAFKEVEGNTSFELRYVGGLNTLLEFEDEEEMKSFLENGEHIWKPWFKSLIPWNQGMQLNK
ncbi:hypothetical protein L1887_28307 [Cichorium endivia]|nr:hypothetical protein L1887_28307 [Cichorium endivia]